MKPIFYILTLIFCENSFCYSQIEDEQYTMSVVETSPQFPGGEKARLKYLSENLKYPQSAIDSGIQGTVHVTFVIETDGVVSDVRVIRGIRGCEDCDKEAIRLVEGMPSWIPGEQRGKPVRVQFNMPIRFSLDNVQNKQETQRE